ncbi:MAG: ABC transporter ATP-binding protein [Pseudonocardiaceae bacterium]
MSGAVVDVADLTIRDTTGRPVVDDVSFHIPAGATLGIVGESGSGKTTIALTLLGVIRPGLHITAGQAVVDGLSVLGADHGALRRLRRHVVSYLGQDPAASLNPTMRVGPLVAELLADNRSDKRTPRTPTWRHIGVHDPPVGPIRLPVGAVAERLAAVGLPSDAEFARRYPHQLSGGQQQRVALARALASDPSVLILDEPTTGLDVVIQELVLTELAAQRRRLGCTTVVISHDLAVVARLADRAMVMRSGVTVDEGEVVGLFSRPRQAYTAALVAACPDPRHAVTRPHHPSRPSGAEPPLEVVDLYASHGRTRRTPRTRGRHRAAGPQGGILAAAGVSLRVDAAECVVMIGSSGSGKTTIARCIAGLHRPDDGQVRLGGEPLDADVARRSVAQRGRIQLIPQDPYGSLNPRRRVGAAIARPLHTIRGLDQDTAATEVATLLERVALRPELADRYPRELSGGERQRVAISRALATNPEVLICDEITSALDTSVQAGILDLLDDLRAQLGLALLFITHDFGVVARIAERVLVLDHGAVCEQGPVNRVLSRPAHDTTRRLLAACRSLDSELAQRRDGGQTDPREADGAALRF